MPGEKLEVQKETGNILTVNFLEVLICPCKILVNYNCLVYNDDTVRYVYAELGEKLHNTF